MSHTVSFEQMEADFAPILAAFSHSTMDPDTGLPNIVVDVADADGDSIFFELEDDTLRLMAADMHTEWLAFNMETAQAMQRQLRLACKLRNAWDATRTGQAFLA